MAKSRRSSSKAALGQQEAELRRSSRGQRFIGEDTGALQARAAEREKVIRMQVAAREAVMRTEREQEAQRAHDELVHRPLWESAAALVLDSARLATTVLTLPMRMARLPFRLAASLLPRWSDA
jgi:hypothetical protein